MKLGAGIIVAGSLMLAACCGIGGCVAVASSGDDNPAASATTGAPKKLEPSESAATVEGAAATTEAAKPTATKPAKPAAATIDDGTWTVGEDVPAGTYKVRVAVEDDLCYWSITKTGSNGGDIINNGLGTKGRPSVVLKKGQDFETARCGVWVKTK